MLRLSIALFALILGACDQLGWQASQDDVRSQVDRLEQSPTEADLRVLLNLQVDGATSYLHIAYVGRLFARYPSLFMLINNDIQTDRERDLINNLGMMGDEVFQYHPELKPDSFDRVYREASWLKKN